MKIIDNISQLFGDDLKLQYLRLEVHPYPNNIAESMADCFVGKPKANH